MEYSSNRRRADRHPARLRRTLAIAVGAPPCRRPNRYLPALHRPFGTFSLPLVDWIIVGVAALTVVPVLEIAKAYVRRTTPGAHVQPSRAAA
jgi:hypothetical protein